MKIYTVVRDADNLSMYHFLFKKEAERFIFTEECRAEEEVKTLREKDCKGADTSERISHISKILAAKKNLHFHIVEEEA